MTAKTDRMRLERFTADDRELLEKLVFDSDVMQMNYGRIFSEDEAGALFSAVTDLNCKNENFGYFKVFACSGEGYTGLAALVPGNDPGHAEIEYICCRNTGSRDTAPNWCRF